MTLALLAGLGGWDDGRADPLDSDVVAEEGGEPLPSRPSPITLADIEVADTSALPSQSHHCLPAEAWIHVDVGGCAREEIVDSLPHLVCVRWRGRHDVELDVGDGHQLLEEDAEGRHVVGLDWRQHDEDALDRSGELTTRD